uniref:Putative thrombospondin type 1 domain-containing protein n=2 Tax=Schistosoma mansoni TaxID=6183 RepID=A0A3Q0KET0_SCHMA
MANYELPLYIKEEYWIPDILITICVPEATHKSLIDIIYEFTQEDYEKTYSISIRNQFTNTGNYYDGGYLNILSFLINICQCLRKHNTNLHCPNPCAKPNVCHDDMNSNGLCMIIPNDEILNNIPIKIRSKLGSIYAYDYECVCVNGYTFNHTLKKCVPIKKHCDSSVCLNNGECEYLPENERSIPDIEFICKCPPAWKGLSCEKPRNPCLEAQRLCGQYSCYRDPTNLKLGYRCDCPKGYKAISTTNPQCININECIEYINDEICLNGGICIDKEPYSIIEHDVIEVTYGFQCICSNGYSGQRCERRPPPLQWTTWSEWTECSVKCGIGVHKRFRNCSLPNRCIGSYVQVSKCQGHVLFCENEEINEFIQSGSKIIKSWQGTQWYLHENYTLNETYYKSNSYITQKMFNSTHLHTPNIISSILEWIIILQFNYQWTINELIILYTIIMMILFTPIYLIMFCFIKLIQYILYRNIHVNM